MFVEERIDPKLKLKEVFGFSGFRGNQEVVINHILEGTDAFVIMPTGAGKSLCYQLPALLREGTTLVISPLIALMKNQVDQLNAFGIQAYFLNSTLTKSEINQVKRDTISGITKLLYLAPETLTKDENIDFLNSARINFIAVDEAHCISEWGHDFRPEYRRIRDIIERLGGLQVVALTATATPKVQLDIQKSLGIENAHIFKSSFNRSNLYYEVRPKKNTKKQLITFIKERKGKSGIVYCLSRKKVEEIAELLNVNGIRALPYHAGLDAPVRMKNQDAFLNEDAEVIVATIAFGMGIDKPDVRFVVHYDTPKSLEGYYQETGRAGRDGLEGDCLLFYSFEDIVKLEKFSKDKSVTERENNKILLEEMAAYAESAVCRRKQLLNYFGEHLENNCGFCDNCVKPKELFEAGGESLKALKAVVQTEQRFGIGHVADVLAGKNNSYIQGYGHDTLEVYGVGKDEGLEFWTSLLRHLMISGFLEKDIENYGSIKITEKGLEFIQNPHSIMASKDHDFSETSETEEKETASVGKSYDEALFDLLKGLRKKIAKEKSLPPYVIFQDPSLEEMATTYPTTIEELCNINGVGAGKAKKFGNPFVELIAKYVEENDIVTAAEVVVKSSVDRSKTKIFIIQQIDKKVDLEEIAEAKDLNMIDLIEEIEHICYSGTKLNLNYYIDHVMDTDRQNEVYDYFMSAETDHIAEALKFLGKEDYSEEEVRLMRIKFLSELAN